MRTLTPVGVLAAAATASLLFAPTAQAHPRGDNGTVKIHDATTDEVLRKNEPHVCTFYLDAFGFDDGQQVDWHIETWAPTAAIKGETVKSGSLTLDAEGHGRTADLSLEDGHYKLFWNFDGEQGRAKHKVFWTDCEDQGGGAGGVAGGQPGGKPSDEPTSDAPSASTPGQESSAEPSSAPSAQNSDLAETGNGAPVGLMSASAAALVAAGGYLLFRRRKAQQR